MSQAQVIEPSVTNDAHASGSYHEKVKDISVAPQPSERASSVQQNSVQEAKLSGTNSSSSVDEPSRDVPSSSFPPVQNGPTMTLPQVATSSTRNLPNSLSAELQNSSSTAQTQIGASFSIEGVPISAPSPGKRKWSSDLPLSNSQKTSTTNGNAKKRKEHALGRGQSLEASVSPLPQHQCSKSAESAGCLVKKRKHSDQKGRSKNTKHSHSSKRHREKKRSKSIHRKSKTKKSLSKPKPPLSKKTPASPSSTAAALLNIPSKMAPPSKPTLAVSNVVANKKATRATNSFHVGTYSSPPSLSSSLSSLPSSSLSSLPSSTSSLSSLSSLFSSSSSLSSFVSSSSSSASSSLSSSSSTATAFNSGIHSTKKPSPATTATKSYLAALEQRLRSSFPQYTAAAAKERGVTRDKSILHTKGSASWHSLKPKKKPTVKLELVQMDPKPRSNAAENQDTMKPKALTVSNCTSSNTGCSLSEKAAKKHNNRSFIDLDVDSGRVVSLNRPSNSVTYVCLSDNEEERKKIVSSELLKSKEVLLLTDHTTVNSIPNLKADTLVLSSHPKSVDGIHNQPAWSRVTSKYIVIFCC